MPYPLFHPQGPRPLPDSISPERFEEEVAEGESDVLEFKRGAKASQLAEAVVAFSNTQGGVVLIGVEDDGTVRGTNISGHKIGELYQQIRDHLHNPCLFEILPVTVGGDGVLVVCTPRNAEGLTQMQDGRVLVRRGASNFKLLGDELQLFVMSRSRRGAEASPTIAPFSDVDKALLEQLCVVWGWDEEDVQSRLLDNRFAVRDSSGLRLTVAGALFLLPKPKAVLDKAYIEILNFFGDAGGYNHREEVVDDLPAQIQVAVEAVSRLIGFDQVFANLRRTDLPRLPKDVLREALANAVAHRSYEISGSPVRVEIHPDYVDIVSPGGFPYPVTPQTIRQQQVSRNSSIIATLRRMELAEEIGQGVDEMDKVMSLNLLPLPEFEEVAGFVRVRLYRTFLMTPQANPDERRWMLALDEHYPGQIEPIDTVVLLAAFRGNLLSNSDARLLLGLDEADTRAVLQRLVSAGLLEQRGERGGARYVISSEVEGVSQRVLSNEELDERVMTLARSHEGRITNQFVRANTGLGPQQTLKALKRLVAAGRLVRHGEKRGTHYTLADGAGA